MSFISDAWILLQRCDESQRENVTRRLIATANIRARSSDPRARPAQMVPSMEDPTGGRAALLSRLRRTPTFTPNMPTSPSVGLTPVAPVSLSTAGVRAQSVRSIPDAASIRDVAHPAELTATRPAPSRPRLPARIPDSPIDYGEEE